MARSGSSGSAVAVGDGLAVSGSLAIGDPASVIGASEGVGDAMSLIGSADEVAAGLLAGAVAHPVSMPRARRAPMAGEDRRFMAAP
jgi:hypothetical protein